MFGGFSPVWVVLFLIVHWAHTAHANLYLPTSEILAAYDMDWRFREHRVFDVTGVLHNALDFTPACEAVPLLPWNQTDIIHVHLPLWTHTECVTAGHVVKALVDIYENGPGFAALLITFDTEEETGNEFGTPWGDPTVFQDAPFQLSIGPLSTAEALFNYTQNYTFFPTVQLTSDAGPWNDHLKGTASSIYNGFLTAIYLALFAYAIFLHVDAYQLSGSCRSSFTIKTWVYVCSQLFITFQILNLWLPLYPSIVPAFFYWYSYTFGFVAYTLLLLTWVRVVSHDKSAKSALSVNAAKMIHVFSYIAILLFFLIMTFAMLSGSFPQYRTLSLLRTYFYYLMPVLLVVQAAIFLFYGIRLIQLLKTFKMTKEKVDLMRRMSILMTFAVLCFILTAFMAIIVILFGDSLTGAWIARVLKDYTIVVLIIAIFTTLNASRKARISSSQPGSSARSSNSMLNVNNAHKVVTGPTNDPEVDESYSELPKHSHVVQVETV